MDNNELNNLAKETYGRTYSWRCTGYIMADGTLLNFSEDGGYTRTIDHRNVKLFFDEDYRYLYDYVVKFMDAGNIRILPENGTINLTKMPTNILLSKLKDFVRYMKGEITLEITDSETSDSICYIEYEDVSPQKVIMDIKHYFIDHLIPLQPQLFESYSESNNTFLKRLQLILILKNNPADETLGAHTWIKTIDDILTYQEAILNDEPIENYTPDYTFNMVKNALRTGYITVYSSYPIKIGIFVTPSKMEAINYAGNNRIYRKIVKLTDVAWIDGMQGQYAPIKKDKI